MFPLVDLLNFCAFCLVWHLSRHAQAGQMEKSDRPIILCTGDPFVETGVSFWAFFVSSQYLVGERN